jgi:hypothetical protein
VNLHKTIAAFVAAVACSQASAVSSVLLQTPVGYAPNVNVVQQLQDECKIDNMLASRVSSILAKRNRTGTGVVDAHTKAENARTLKLTIMRVLDGNENTGKGLKAITVKAELFAGQSLERQQHFGRHSRGGPWGAFKDSCAVFHRITFKLTKDLSRWTFSAGFEPADDEPMPGEDVVAEPLSRQGEDKGAMADNP